jgi:hypothetical protein
MEYAGDRDRGQEKYSTGDGNPCLWSASIPETFDVMKERPDDKHEIRRRSQYPGIGPDLQVRHVNSHSWNARRLTYHAACGGLGGAHAGPYHGAALDLVNSIVPHLRAESVSL